MNTPAWSLFDCIQELADRQTNPVLEVLPDDGSLELNTRYPQPILDFGKAGLRAYYHCHAVVDQPLNEHGHFHIFIEQAQNSWSHVAGLSMDHHGQPVQWFSVNHWVAGEQWCDAETLVSAVRCFELPDDVSLIEKWLFAMLDFYTPVIEKLLQERDDTVNSYCREWQLDAILQEKSIYFLSSCDVNLLEDLSLPMIHQARTRA